MIIATMHDKTNVPSFFIIGSTDVHRGQGAYPVGTYDPYPASDPAPTHSRDRPSASGHFPKRSQDARRVRLPRASVGVADGQ